MLTAVRREINEDDHILWLRMLEGDEEALAELFCRYYEMLYDYGLKLSHLPELTRDSIQDVFVYIWEKRNNIAKVDSVKAYLLVCLRRHVLHLIEKYKKNKKALESVKSEHINGVVSLEDLVIVKTIEAENREQIIQALNQIPPRVREALYLKTYDGLSYKEIAQIMNISPQVARNYVYEAFQKLRTLLVKQLN